MLSRINNVVIFSTERVADKQKNYRIQETQTAEKVCIVDKFLCFNFVFVRVYIFYGIKMISEWQWLKVWRIATRNASIFLFHLTIGESVFVHNKRIYENYVSVWSECSSQSRQNSIYNVSCPLDCRRSQLTKQYSYVIALEQ